MPAGPRQLLQDHCAALSDDLENLFAESREHTRCEFAEQLNQVARRLRLAPDPAELCATLSDAAAYFASGIQLFRIEDGVARSPRIDVPLASAPAIASAAAGQDPLVALATSGEVSQALVELLGHEENARAHIFPVMVGDETPAVVYAWGTVQSPAIELLAQVAGAVWTALSEPEPEPPPVTDLVTIAPAPALPTFRQAGRWGDLTPEEQSIHLHAQRFARVRVAEMRLAHGDAVQSGRMRHNLYEALQEPIDSAREAFRTRFFTCASMVDYLDLELIRALANEDPILLGHSYPGPLV